WDLPHGNGTEHIFERDPDVLYVSTHQYPFYPGTGAVDEVGEGAGAGRTLNLPFPAGFGDREFARAFDEVIVPICRQFGPEFVLVSAGFDCGPRGPPRGPSVAPPRGTPIAPARPPPAGGVAGGRPGGPAGGGARGGLGLRGDL